MVVTPSSLPIPQSQRYLLPSTLLRPHLLSPSLGLEMAINGKAILRSAHISPPLDPLRLQRRLLLRAHQHLSRRCCGHWGPHASRPHAPLSPSVSKGGSFSFLRSFSVNTILTSILDDIQRSRSARAAAGNSSRLGVLSNKEVIKKTKEQTLKKGLLLEFRKDSGRSLLAVAEKPDGKQNWMVYDQNGVGSSIRPQQITYIIPGIQDFECSQIPCFLQKAESLLDPFILECAWVELLEKSQTVTAMELAEIMYGSTQPLESYCAHILLSKDDIYFSATKSKGYCSVYQARPSAQVEELLQRKLVKEACEKAYKKEIDEFIQLLSSAKSSPPHLKPPKCSWTFDENVKRRIDALEAYAIDACKDDAQKKMAGMILRAMRLSNMPSSAVDLLIDIGYFPVHVNLDLLRFNLSVGYSDQVLSAAEDLLASSLDLDEANRVDLTHLKVYAIDVDEADELDDALSAMRLENGRIKVWIHVADPSSIVQPRSTVDRDAMRRGSSIFLPTATYPMFPEKLAMGRMSLQQGELCRVVSVSVVLNPDGSIAEYSVDNAIIRPTYMLTYESAAELLYLGLEEETELQILSEAASLRLKWRLGQGAIDITTIGARVKVPNPDDPEPTINLYVEDQTNLAIRLVKEMMLLCGEAVATFGYHHCIPLPFRGQPQSNVSSSLFSHLPEGPVRSSAYIKVLRAAEMDFRKPIPHEILGLPAYVQFTSPVRRYTDMLAHYQVKAFLRGDHLPFSPGLLQGITSLVNTQSKLTKRLCNNSQRYWILEYLRRQPHNRKFRAVILRFVENRMAELLLLEVGIQQFVCVLSESKVGDEIYVVVKEAKPRQDVLVMNEALDSPEDA